MQVYQRFNIDVVHPACNYTLNKTPAQAFSYEICKFLHPATLLKARLWHRCLLVNFEKIFSLQVS